MPPEHYNPFNNPEFRAEMAAMLDEKLEPLNSLEPRISALELWRWYIIGIFTAIVAGLKLFIWGK